MSDKPKFESLDITFTLPDKPPSKLFEIYIPGHLYTPFWPDEGDSLTLKSGEGLDLTFEPKK